MVIWLLQIPEKIRVSTLMETFFSSFFRFFVLFCNFVLPTITRGALRL